MNAGQYARAQQRALHPLERIIRRLLALLGFPVTDAATEELALRLWRPMEDARIANYGAALRYLDDLDLPDRIVVPRLRPYPLRAVQDTLYEVRRTLRVNGGPIDEANHRDVIVRRRAQTAIAGPLTQQAQEPARQTIMRIAEDDIENDGLDVGWARQLTGAKSCGFCAMLASRGPVYKSRESAIGRGGNPLDTYHPNCDCVVVLVVSWRSWEGRAAFERLEDLWSDTGAKASGKDARNAFRREWEKQARAGQTDKYVSESMKPRRAA